MGVLDKYVSFYILYRCAIVIARDGLVSCMYILTLPVDGQGDNEWAQSGISF